MHYFDPKNKKLAENKEKMIINDLIYHKHSKKVVFFFFL
jgi:hypothetical protein